MTMRYAKLLMFAVPLLWVGGCSDDDGVTDLGPIPPQALIRFINAVPDTGTVDFRFIDKVENLPMLMGVALQQTSGFFQRTDGGARHVRIFPFSSLPGVTSVAVLDTTITLDGNNTRQTLVYTGRAAGNQDRLVIIPEDVPPPTPPANSIAIRVLHVAYGTTAPVGNVDVHIVPVTSATAATPADWQTTRVAQISNVAYLSKSAYVNVPVRPTTTGALYRFVVTAAGSTTPLFAVTPNQPGLAAPAGASYGPQPGMQISGSVFTAAVIGAPIAGTKDAPATPTATVTLMPDKVLNP